jgi:fluoroquinolone transport system permease protein
MKSILSLVSYDLKQIMRDNMLLMLVFVPLFMVFMIRALLPMLDSSLALYNIAIQDYMPLIFSYFFLMLCPSLFGLASALLILDDLDDQVLLMIRVTPLPYGIYLFYRIGVFTMLPSFFYIILTSFLMNFPILNWPAFLLIALIASFFGPMFSLLILSLARNKIEGLAMMKATGIFLIAPVAGYFIGSWHRHLLYIFPTYAPLKAFWMLSTGFFDWLSLVIGIFVLAFSLFGLWNLAKRKLMNPVI